MRSLLALLFFFLAGAAALVGQEEAPTISVDPVTGGPWINLGVFLEDPALRGALHSGLPVRVEVRLELWKDGFFDSQESATTWRASVVHDPVAGDYEVVVAESEAVVVDDLLEAAQLLESVFEVEMTPSQQGRYYYLAEVDLETLALSDLEELQRWLQGDIGAVVRGNRGPQSALSRGVRRIFVRALGLPNRRERLRTQPFDWTPEQGPGQPPGQVPGAEQHPDSGDDLATSTPEATPPRQVP